MNRYDNVKVEVDGDEVLIRCSVGQDVQSAPSASGKTMVYATTGGARVVEVDGARFSLNLTLYQKR